MSDRDLMRFVAPALIAMIGAEKLALHRRNRSVEAATVDEESPLGYDRDDTIASLTMCAASFVIPPLLSKAFAPIVPGRGKYGRVLVIGVLGAAAVTTAADAIARTDTGRLSRLARRIRPSSAIATAATGVVAGSLTWASRASANALWGRGGWKRDLGSGIATHAAALVIWDFLTYWDHRLRHSSRALWAVHSVHHSSERFNLSTALRNPVAEPLMLVVPYGFMSMLGFRPRVVETARAIDLTYQFWLHTELVDRLGFAEEVLNTPSHHRVHHGSQSEYLDRNHGGILIIWDRIFGTFQREGRRVRFGIAGARPTNNPIRIITDEYRNMLRDVARAESWSGRLRIILGRPTSPRIVDPHDRVNLELAS